MRKCGHCKEIKNVKEFGKDKHNKDGIRSYCKKCVCNMFKKYCLNYPEKVKISHDKWFKKYYSLNSRKHIRQHLKYWHSLRGRDANSNLRYKVSISDMLEWQDYKCAICQERENNSKLCIDHDHQSGQIRMLLCSGCNHGGKLSDNIELLRAKIEYLLSF